MAILSKIPAEAGPCFVENCRCPHWVHQVLAGHLRCGCCEHFDTDHDMTPVVSDDAPPELDASSSLKPTPAAAPTSNASNSAANKVENILATAAQKPVFAANVGNGAPVPGLSGSSTEAMACEESLNGYRPEIAKAKKAKEAVQAAKQNAQNLRERDHIVLLPVGLEGAPLGPNGLPHYPSVKVSFPIEQDMADFVRDGLACYKPGKRISFNKTWTYSQMTAWIISNLPDAMAFIRRLQIFRHDNPDYVWRLCAPGKNGKSGVPYSDDAPFGLIVDNAIRKRGGLDTLWIGASSHSLLMYSLVIPGVDGWFSFARRHSAGVLRQRSTPYPLMDVVGDDDEENVKEYNVAQCGIKRAAGEAELDVKSSSSKGKRARTASSGSTTYNPGTPLETVDSEDSIARSARLDACLMKTAQFLKTLQKPYTPLFSPHWKQVRGSPEYLTSISAQFSEIW
ncbi:hypothetical protein AURDEDRAFT_166738 [Auricularia subglabra TFB-10046 SS5]|nr:hypothetical protein AURDEDRAFT_166738 [Auricularia subglabra TFB-10046 SS5]